MKKFNPVKQKHEMFVEAKLPKQPKITLDNSFNLCIIKTCPLNK